MRMPALIAEFEQAAVRMYDDFGNQPPTDEQAFKTMTPAQYLLFQLAKAIYNRSVNCEFADTNEAIRRRIEWAIATITAPQPGFFYRSGKRVPGLVVEPIPSGLMPGGVAPLT